MLIYKQKKGNLKVLINLPFQLSNTPRIYLNLKPVSLLRGLTVKPVFENLSGSELNFDSRNGLYKKPTFYDQLWKFSACTEVPPHDSYLQSITPVNLHIRYV